MVEMLPSVLHNPPRHQGLFLDYLLASHHLDNHVFLLHLRVHPMPEITFSNVCCTERLLYEYDDYMITLDTLDQFLEEDENTLETEELPAAHHLVLLVLKLFQLRQLLIQFF